MHTHTHMHGHTDACTRIGKSTGKTAGLGGMEKKLSLSLLCSLVLLPIKKNEVHQQENGDIFSAASSVGNLNKHFPHSEEVLWRIASSQETEVKRGQKWSVYGWRMVCVRVRVKYVWLWSDVGRKTSEIAVCVWVGSEES